MGDARGAQGVLDERLPNELEVIGDALMPLRSELVGSVVESAYNRFGLMDGLMGAGFCFCLANTPAVCQLEGIKHTDDHSDARNLAHLLLPGHSACKVHLSQGTTNGPRPVASAMVADEA